MGRTGKLFAFEHYGVAPDILTLAKAFGGGLPIGTFVSSEAHMKSLTHDPMLGHITTFGGNPVCCASAHATLEVLTQEKLIDQVEEKGRYLQSLLQHPDIREIRRIGLMFAMDFASAEKVNRIVARARENGIILYWFLSHPYSIRMAPPLTIGMDQLKESAEMILDAIEHS
jgi:acetylornithine/succinyldiaminopimelate/putrescine aminotransferase